MITVTSLESAHFFGDIIPSMYRLRYKSFVERQSYEVPIFKNMEWDTYDTPATVYFAWRDYKGIVRGTTRIVPTSRPYMLEEIWPHLVTTIDLPKCSDIWEASRFCIDKSLPIEMRKRIHAELIHAFLEYGLENNIHAFIGVMPPPIWRAVFINAGWPIRFIGPVEELRKNERVVAGEMRISEEILASVRAHSGITGNVLDGYSVYISDGVAAVA